MGKKKETQLSVLNQIRDILIEARGPIDKRPFEVCAAKRFIKLPGNWVKDTQTNLEWGPSSSERMPWEKAKAYCEKEGGRLPTVRELESLIDRTKHNPAVDKDAFPDTKSAWYWTSEVVAGYSGCAWIVDFSDGVVCYSTKANSGYVRAVRPSQ